MAVIYLRHPTHGEKVACSVQEADFDARSGWVRFEPEDVTDEAPQAPDVPNFLAVRRRGRPRKELTDGNGG
jgi:nitrite reductase/ring-hydroxylating ferredoxin subunit